MTIQVDQILSVLDKCCDNFTFPMLDNGYWYPATTRLSLYRSEPDWAIVIEVFGYSPRAGLPDVCINTFASALHNRDVPEQYVNTSAYANYLTNNPNNDSRFIHPIEDGDWVDVDSEFLAEAATEITLRGQRRVLPSIAEYAKREIDIADPPRVHVFELCRLLAYTDRELVLTTAQERRLSISPEMTQILQLEEWHHPDVVYRTNRPSGSETFQQLAQVLATGDVTLYSPSQPPNTHWRNWPDGGLL